MYLIKNSYSKRQLGLLNIITKQKFEASYIYSLLTRVKPAHLRE